MSHKKVLSKLIIAAVTVVFLLSGTAEAGSSGGSGKLAAFDLSSVLNQTWSWLASAWAGSTTTTNPTDTTSNTTPSCPPLGCPPDDSGYGIDPNGGK